MNLAATLVERGHRVLLVDSDPQCNLTSYLVAEDVVDDLLDNSDGSEGRTVWSALKPISEAAGGVKLINPIEVGIDGLFLLPGDIRLSEFETDLTGFWSDCFQRKLRGFRGTTALSELVTNIASQLGIDYVFFDSGPNIGALNRIILLDCDFFVVPVACDLFSLRALKTLGRTLVDWITSWRTIAELAPTGTYLLAGHPSFLGYIAQGFKVYAGAVASGHAEFLTQIEKEVNSELVALLRDVDPALAVGTSHEFKLGQIKQLGALVPASQEQGLPVFSVRAGSAYQRWAAEDAFAALAVNVESRVQQAAPR
jgi:cellulose biosynthesis protein BcsQ